MRMVSLRIVGFRRFERESTLDLTPRVLAVVGPNEAGKSSLLDAMEYLTTPPEDGFKDRDFSGWSRPEDEKTIISALFEIEDEDRAEMEGIPGAESVRLWHTWRKADASADALRGSWRQSKVSIELNEQNGWLNVYPYDADSDEHSRIEERSDGFRAFLALLAFTTRHSKEGKKLVLGIDEAERHLHYDAQVDLVNVLTEQTFATQIVYTTHSAGCLPEDLGSAIRVVSPVTGDRSELQNAFWSSQAEDRSGGFTSLLMAMGAEAVAFTPARRAVIAEGPSDALLLPALFREASGLGRTASLQLQVAGGLASTPPRLLPQLEGEAGHVVYLTDSDTEGLNYEQALLDAGVAAERIFTLRDGEEKGLSIEDLVEKSLYVEVVNLLAVELRGHEGPAYELETAPETGIAKHAELWASEQGIEPLPKPAVAEHLLRLSGASLAYATWDPGAERKPRALLRASRGSALRGILSEVREKLALEPLEVGLKASHCLYCHLRFERPLCLPIEAISMRH